MHEANKGEEASMSTASPKTLSVVVDNIPPELKEGHRWATWRWERRGHTWTKPPLNPSSGYYARINDPDTWGSFEAALRHMIENNLPGIGVMFHPDDPIAGVDLDACRDPETGKIQSWALEIVKDLDSYAEISPSQTGLKIFVRAGLPPGRRRKGRIEMYDRGRFFATTGCQLPKVPSCVCDRQAELIALHRRVFGEQKNGKGAQRCGGSRRITLNDAELIHRARRAANGEKFARLWAGDCSDYRSGDNDGHSEADLALCSLLAFWCGPDEERIGSLFRQSGLMRTKWERADYRALTFAAALDRDEFWSGRESLRRGRTYVQRKGVVSLG